MSNANPVPEWALEIAAHDIWQNTAMRLDEWPPGSMPYVIATALAAAYLRGCRASADLLDLLAKDKGECYCYDIGADQIREQLLGETP